MGLGVVAVIINAFPVGMILALSFWIYLGVIVWKKIPVFDHKIEPSLATKYFKRLKSCLIAAGISLPIAIAGIIMHNVESSRSETEESLYFFIGIVALYLFIIASAGGFVIFLKGRRKLV